MIRPRLAGRTANIRSRRVRRARSGSGVRACERPSRCSRTAPGLGDGTARAPELAALREEYRAARAIGEVLAARARYADANAPCRGHGAVGARACPGLVAGGASALRERPDDAGGGASTRTRAATVRSRRCCGIARDKVDRRLGSFERLSFIVADASGRSDGRRGRSCGDGRPPRPLRRAPRLPTSRVPDSRFPIPVTIDNSRTSARCRSRGRGGASSLPATRPSSSSSRAPARP